MRSNGESLVNAIIRIQLRNAFTRLEFLPGAMSKPFARVTRRKIGNAFTIWKQHSKIAAFMEQREA